MTGLTAPDAGAAPLLAALHARAFDRPWSAAELASLMNAPGVHTIAVEDGALLGFVMIRAIAGEAEVLTLVVSPDLRRRGLGLVLVEAGAGAAAAAGAAQLWLEVAEDNEAAIALYRRAGFEQSGRRPRYYRREGAANVDALVMRRQLNTATA